MASVSAYVEKSARSTGDFGPTASDQKLHLVVYGKMSQRHVCMSTFVLENELFTVKKKKKLRIETGEQAYRIAVVSTSAFEGVEQVCARVPNRLREYLTNSAFFFNFRLS